MSTVAVIGAGLMGSGIAQTSAQYGYDVLLMDVDQAIAEKAIAKIGKGLERLVSRDKMTAADAEALLGRITPISGYEPMADAEFIIEAATEREEIKLKIIESAGQVLGANSIMASNTSSIPITRMGAKAVDPKRFIGMHFFNPVPVMGLIEIIPGLATAPDTLARSRAYAETLKKEVVVAGDDPGFVVNRILVPMINEAIGILADGVASAEDIDAAMKLGANHPIGPLALADLIGNDVNLAIMETLYDEFGDTKYRPHPLLRKMVRAGLLGRKSGKGFFDYTN